MAYINAHKIQDEKFNSLGLTKTIVNEEQVNTYVRGLDAASETNPVLVLLHGYPQSAYMWRHFLPLLPHNIPIFVPDLPGYGCSAAIKKNDKLSIGNAIISALRTEVKRTSSGSPPNDIPVVLVGHDRGARVAHRLAVSGAEGVRIQGVVLIDIVPTSTQWQASRGPFNAARELTGFFHWPFLANVPLATRMITAYGPSAWTRDMVIRWAGSNPHGLVKLKDDDSLAVYGAFFEQEHVLQASCEDYREGAGIDVEQQEHDQQEGRKIGMPVLLVYSQEGIGQRFDFGTVWKDWVHEGVDAQYHALGEGVGHFGPEEAPEECAKAVMEWMGRFAK